MTVTHRWELSGTGTEGETLYEIIVRTECIVSPVGQRMGLGTWRYGPEGLSVGPSEIHIPTRLRCSAPPESKRVGPYAGVGRVTGVPLSSRHFWSKVGVSSSLNEDSRSI